MPPRSAERRAEAVRVVTACQGCDSGDLELVVDFGHQPPVHSLLRREQLDLPETAFPLRLIRCRGCGLVQLGHVVDPSLVFPEEYPYLTGLTPILRTTFRDLACEANERLGLGPRDLVVDVGSNDGTLLEGFKEIGTRVLGVEPTNIASIANDHGIPTLQRFFDPATAEAIAAERGPARVVTATNVIAHVDDVHAFLDGIRELLADDGVFVSESHYLLGLVDRLQYDTIYHEHLRYYSLRPLALLLERSGLHVYDTKPVATHGGSIRVWATKGRARERSERYAEMLRAEDAYGLYGDEAFRRFRDRVVRNKHRLLDLLLGLRAGGARVAGVGAPARASMVLNSCHLDGDLIDYIGEQSGSLKVGLFMPGSHVPVVDEQRLFDEQPDHAIVLSWHIGEEIMRKLCARGYRGRFVVPLPEPAIVEPDAGLA